MSYDLDALPRALPAPIDPAQLTLRVRAFAPALATTTTPRGLSSGGTGFTLEPTPRGVRLSSAHGRTSDDEHAMEITALLLAGGDGAVVDRHSGHVWPAPVLAEWLRVAGLFSGRALAVNEERIARRGEHTARDDFAHRVSALTTYATGASATPALRARLHDELAYYATRPSLVWFTARALASLGDFERLALLTRAPFSADAPDAFAVAAEYGAPAAGLFAEALGDPDPNHRRTAARALHRLATPAVFPLITRALQDKRATVREAVLEAEFDRVMALPGAHAALAPVLAHLAHDTSSIVRRLIARWL